MKNQSSSKYIADLGEQLERHRLLQNIPQTDLAKKAGISTRTLRRFESGEGGTLDSFIRLLIALNIDDNLALLIPDSTVRPMERVRQIKKERVRASGKRKSQSTNEVKSAATRNNKTETTKTITKTKTNTQGNSKWTWGDEKS